MGQPFKIKVGMFILTVLIIFDFVGLISIGKFKHISRKNNDLMLLKHILGMPLVNIDPEAQEIDKSL